MTTTLLAIGESLVDVVEHPDDRGTVEHPGGSPLNIAFGAARLGLPSTLLTEIGSDARGRAIVDHLATAGVTLDPSSLRDEPTSSATAVLQADGSARYVFDLRWSLPEGEDLPPASIVHTGSIAAFLEPGGAQIVERLRAATAATVADPPVVTFDPNMRPSIITDHPAALARFTEIAGLATLVKLSDEDAEWLYPDAASLDEAIDSILALGPALVVVTRGGEGAVLATAAERVPVPGRPVEVVDTIGAGDSFMSALIVQLARMLDAGTSPARLRDGSAFDAPALAALGDFAARCAAITVSRAGANPPTTADLA
ncbi:carbohydrate kinase [Herbiconiux sp. KACC 21604]|uniref:carbohydrate kinase family protein n=1 Tax=unclassified Herbiconiux TaxID=2618217 RepID=UPI001492A7B2|nr:carbohydrate kinase [Herbiconiux sp. SALV-R1]QJU55540.1 carbohydrate kinase [Herbiconiux sp. SALV-R1]WPO86726.1 carbohydrate kinase [Herbiconiux sp. KACC 21604]